MSKTFTYTKITGHYYCNYSDEWEEDGIEFDYEVEDKDLLPEIVDLLYEEYFSDEEEFEDEELERKIKDSLKRAIDDNYLVEQLADQYEEALKDIFYDEAKEHYND